MEVLPAIGVATLVAGTSVVVREVLRRNLLAEEGCRA